MSSSATEKAASTGPARPEAWAPTDRRIPKRWRRLAPVLMTGAALLALSGCALRLGPPRPAPRARPAPGYEARVDSLGAVDTTRLRGRRIALDPGHGGGFRGSLGVNGLTESAVNLGVALHLRELLEARGATVFMTRSEDRDFTTPGDNSLRADLAERTSLANAFAADLFVSIHHNADAGGAHDVNEIQTYYKLGDDGPSLDAAESVHRYLVRNLGIRAHRILPGNYFVLRGSVAPALLTESSYLTNPDVEARLALPEKQRLEAEALYLGIAHFFARGAPTIESFVARGATDTTPDSTFSAVASPAFEAAVSGAFDFASLQIDGVEVPIDRFGARLIARPANVLAAGPHEAVLDVRRTGAGAAPRARLSFAIARPVEGATASAWPPHPPPAGQPLGVRFALHDRFGASVPDTIPLRIAWAGGRHDTTVTCRDGVAWIYLRDAQPGRTAFDLQPLDGRGGHWPASLIVEPVPRGPSVWAGFLQRCADTGLAPLLDVPATREPAPGVAWLNRDGFAVLPSDSVGRPRRPRVRGYRTCAIDGGSQDAQVAFTPIARGVLHGKRIVLDPDGGGENAAGVGRDGTRAALVNMRVARMVRGFLEAAGASVRLTRDGNDALSEVERVQISETFGADRFLRIGHRAEPPRLGHFFSSAGGRAWAERTAETLERLGFARPSIGDDAQYPLQQTSCPALYVSVARVDDGASEDALHAPGALRAEAYALYLALLREWAGTADFAVDSLFIRDAEGEPVAGAAVTFGDALILESDAGGVIRFARTETGPIEAAVSVSRVTARTILLESARGVILTGPRGR